jgi:hypothetical protein
VRPGLHSYVCNDSILVKTGFLSRKHFRRIDSGVSAEPTAAEKFARHNWAGAKTMAHWRLGQALEREGRKQEAISEIEAALGMDPNLSEARNELKRMQNGR